MKTLNIPLISAKDLDVALETEGALFHVDQVGWPEAFPYAPFCAGRIAHTDKALVVDFRVSGLDLRVQNLQDNGRSWEDSTCEIFIQVPGREDYYNFEVNAGGYLLAANGPGREGRTKLPEEVLAKVGRIRSLNIHEPVDNKGGIWNWRVGLVIPFEIIGLSEAPATLRANMYKCGDLTAHPHYLSWSPIDTPKPDFHRPEFFGELILA